MIWSHFKTDTLYIEDHIELDKNPESKHYLTFKTFVPTKPLRRKSKSFSNIVDLFKQTGTRLRSHTTELRKTPLHTSCVSIKKSAKERHCATPPLQKAKLQKSSSTKLEEENAELFEVSMVLIDNKSPEYQTVYDRWNRNVKLSIKNIQACLNMRTFVTILDFFSIGTEQEILKQRSKYDSTKEIQQIINTKMNISIDKLRLILNKDHYELASVILTNLTLKNQIRDDDMQADGSINSVLLLDKTKFGDRYPKRLYHPSSVDDVIQFSFFKYGKTSLSQQREFEMSVNVKISPVTYTHTNRFHQELVSFLVHMQQMLEVAQRGYNQGLNDPQRAGRIKLDIQLKNPIVILPESGYTDRVLHLHFGCIDLRNSFVQNKTVQIRADYNTLIDRMSISLTDCQFSTSCRLNNNNISEQIDPINKEVFDINITMERNLDKDLCKKIADTSISLKISNVLFQLDREQYWVVRGMLDHNLGEPMPEFIRPEFTKALEDIAISDKERFMKIFGDWIGMEIKMSLENVAIELGFGQKYQNIEPYQPHILLNLKDCKLCLYSRASGSKKIVFSCNKLTAEDLLNKRPEKYKTVFSSAADEQGEIVFETVDTSQIHLYVYLHQARVYLDPLWLKASQMLLLVNPFESRHKNLRKRLDNLLKSMNQVPPVPVQQLDPPKMKISFNLHDAKNFLIEDFNDVNSPMMVLTSSFIFNFDETRQKYDSNTPLAELMVHKCSLHSFSCDKLVSIIEQLELNVQLRKDNPSKQKSTAHTLYISDCKHLRIHLSYQDVLMIVRIMKRYQDGVKDLKSLEDKAPVNLPSDNRAKIKLKRVSAVIPSINFTVIDDCYDADVPLVLLKLFDLRCGLGINSESKVLDVAMGLELNYYNRNISAYEPIIEEYYPRITIRQKPHLSEITVGNDTSQHGRLVTTITKDLIYLVNQTKQTWSKHLGKDINTTERKKFVPYILKNETGGTIYYSVEENSSKQKKNVLIFKNLQNEKKLEKDAVVELCIDKTKKLDFLSTIVTSKVSEDDRVKLDQLRFRISSYYPSEAVTISRLGTSYRYTFIQNLDDIEELPSVLRFVVSIKPYGSAQKLITIKSSLIVKSFLDRDLILYNKVDGDTVDINYKSRIVKKSDEYPISLSECQYIQHFIPKEWGTKYNYKSTPVRWMDQEKLIQIGPKRRLIEINATHNETEENIW